MNGKLTKAQRSILARIASNGPQPWPWGAKPVLCDTMRRAGWIEPLNRLRGDPVYEITQAGRAALSQEGEDAAVANSAGALASERSPGAAQRKSDGGAS